MKTNHLLLKLLLGLILFGFIISMLNVSYAIDNPYPIRANGNGPDGYCNCTWTAWQVTKETLGMELPSWGNADLWYYNAQSSGFRVGSTPAKNSIVCYNYQHVGFVSDVNSNGEIYVKEGGFNYYHENPVNDPSNDYFAFHEGWKNTENVLGYIYLNPPVIDYAYVEPRSMNGKQYKIVIEAHDDDNNINKVLVRTWTETKSGANGRTDDDLVEQIAKKNKKGHYEVTIKKSDHNNEGGMYRSEIYVFDANGNHDHRVFEQVSMDSVYINPPSFEARIALKSDPNWVIAVNGSGDVVLRPYDSTLKYQVWKFTKGDSGDFKITNKQTGLVLDVEGLKDVHGTNIMSHTSNNQVNQRFYMFNYNGGVRFSARCSSDLKGIDVPNLLLEEGNSIKLGSTLKSNNKAQTFILRLQIGVISLSNEQAYPDVPNGKWYTNSVKYVKNAEIMSGYADGNFGPDDPIARGQIALMLYRLAGEPDVSDLDNPFTDVLDGKYFTNAVKWAYANGITTGKTATSFDPYGNVTRQELALFIARFAEKCLNINTATSYNIIGIADYNDVASWARSAMQYIMEKGIITGDMSAGYARILPKKNATRAESATIFERFINGIMNNITSE